jgi:hypothetical protein
MPLSSLTNMQTFEQFFLTEMPQHYAGDVVYQKPTKFIPISLRNISSYKVLGERDGLVFVVDADNTTGFVFDVADLKSGSQTAIPVMRVSLRDSGINNLKQAHHLRIRQEYAQKNITTTWYQLYVNAFGGIVSDAEHLEGGKNLWKSFIKATGKGYITTLYNKATGESKPVDSATSDSDIWSMDASKRDTVIVMVKESNASDLDALIRQKESSIRHYQDKAAEEPDYNKRQRYDKAVVTLQAELAALKAQK